MDKNRISPTRRTVLGAAAALPAALALGGTIASTAAKSANGARWYALKAKYDALLAETRQADAEHDAAEDLAAPYRVPTPNVPLFQRATSAEWQRSTAHNAEVNKRYNIDALGERCDACYNALSDLRSKLLVMPAPDRGALNWKIRNLWGDDQLEQEYSDGINMRLIRPIIADAERLLGNGEA